MSAVATNKKKGSRSAIVIPFILASKNKKEKSMGKRAEVVAPAGKGTNRSLVRIDDLYTFEPLTNSQRNFFKLYKENTTAIMMHGVAGTGKTFIALYKALEEVLDPSKRVKKVIIVRSAVPSRDIGFLPGDEMEKVEIYKQPYKDICGILFGRNKNAFERLEEQNHVEFMTTSFLRGLTLDNAVIIVDEAQNLSWPEINTIMTRVGENSKIIFCGDWRQTDLIRKHDMSGLKKFIEITRHMPSFRNIEFSV